MAHILWKTVVPALSIGVALSACTQDGGRYSSNPVDALNQTKAYLEQQEAYAGTQQLATLTAGRIDLGKKLFHDKRLSASGQVACATCHNPSEGYTQNKRSLPAGASQALGGRNAPSLYDVISRRTLFHDGRAASLESQAKGPLLNQREMANTSMEALAVRMRGYRDYERFFSYAYGAPANAGNIAAALAAYQRTLITGPNRFDLWRYQNKASALSPKEVRGYQLFTGKARCSTCHTIGPKSAPFTDEGFHQTGYERTKPEALRGADLGRFAVTGQPADRFAFRTPTLRNIALTAPYMHDGRLQSLHAVVSFFNREQDLQLTGDEQDQLVAFLRALTSAKRP
ncbi:MAG: cytochrome c peroxidase [Pseudomonadota bacterium]